MAKNNSGNVFTISQGFLSQLLFGAFLTFILMMTGSPTSLSIFFGVMGGLVIGWFSTASKTGPKTPTVASSDGIDAGLKYWLLFLFGFVFLGYNPPMSVLLGAIAGVGGGWVIAWWGSKEETRTQLVTESEDDTQTPSDRITRQKIRKPTRRLRRPRGSFNFRFWER
ncbi:MAG: hypothetical protein ACHBN1_11900 [Heteroscytonema crispum UTEX LB 1556]